MNRDLCIAEPSVAILMCTYQGDAFIKEQLESFRKQTHSNWSLHVSDDGSNDATVETIKLFAAANPSIIVEVKRGPGKGFAQNFLKLINDSTIVADYYAFSDQDDIWQPEKLERAIKYLKSVSGSQAALYCSRTLLVNQENEVIGMSPLFSKSPSFQNALVQSIAGGNTMVLNHSAIGLLREIGSEIDIVTHDWWAYLVVSACGGKIIYDKVPFIRYRQHEKNLVGSNIGWSARYKRLVRLFEGVFQDWNRRNIQGLELIVEKMTPENRERFALFRAARKESGIKRWRSLLASGVYRQTFVGNVGLWLAAAGNKI